MKKKLIAGAIAGAALLAMAAPLMAAKPVLVKVDICHATDSFDVLANEFTLVIGHTINVSENALSAHLAHGDFEYTENFGITDQPGGWFGNLTWRQIAENNGLNVSDEVNCAGFVIDY